MKIALIQSPWSGTTGGPLKKFAVRWVSSPPLGLLYLASFAERHGHEAIVFDLDTEFLTPDELADRIKASGAQLIGLTATTPVYFVVRAYAQHLRRLEPAHRPRRAARHGAQGSDVHRRVRLRDHA